MSVILKELTCPNCNSSVQQLNPTSQTLVCKVCNTHIEASDGNAIGSGRKLPPAPKPIVLGQTFMLPHGVEGVVLGRVDYEGWDSSDRWQWHEWLIGGQDGRMFWLSYDDEDGFGLFYKRRIKAPFNAATDRSIPLSKNGNHIHVKERYPARISGVEGELTWLAKQGNTLGMIDATGGGKRYSIQYTQHDIEMYEGVPMDEQVVAAAFKNKQWLTRTKRAANNTELLMLSGIAALLCGAIALFFAIALSTSGTLVTESNVAVSRTETTAIVPFEVESTNRPMLIRLNSGTLPRDSWAQLEVSVIDPLENETFIGGNEFWHESGVDEDGTWVESDYSGSTRFIPLETGTHQLKIEFEDAATNVNGTTVDIQVYRNYFINTWLIIYGIIALIGGGILLALSKPKKTQAFISSLMED